MTGYLTTHVLDLGSGAPASGLKIELLRDNKVIATAITNTDGRTDAPILPKEKFATGAYELRFHAGDYLVATGRQADFLDIVPVAFKMSEDDHYHVPLLLSPYGFSTYRGS